jgi:hypothetical protein
MNSNRRTIAWWMVLVLAAALLLTGIRSSEEWWAIPGFVALAIASVWVVGPIRLHRDHWLSADPTFDPFDPDDPETSTALGNCIRRATGDLESLGFAAVGHYRLEDHTPGVVGTLSLYENRPARDLAKLIVLTAGERTVTTLTFVSEYADNTAFATSDFETPLLTPPAAIRPGSMTFPGIGDACRLYRAHRAGQRGQGEPLEDPIGGDPVAYCRVVDGRVRCFWVWVGYYTLDAERRLLRPTWKGAILMAWKATAPVPSIRKILRRRLAAWVLAKLGIE